MNGYSPPGFVSGGFAFALAVLGLVILVPLLARLPFVLWRPGKGRFAKGFAAAALVLVLCGAGLFLAEELAVASPSFRRVLDQAAPWLALVVLALAIVTGVRAGRRRPAAQARDGATARAPEAASDVAGQSPTGQDG